MDGDRFDALIRTLSSRRALSGALLGTITGLLGMGAVEARHCPPTRKHCGRRCIPKRDCCTNADCQPRATGRVCTNGRCTCPPARPRRCGARCVSRSGCCTARDCPAGAGCSRRSVCVCPPGSRPCGSRCALAEGAPCAGRPLEDCCSGSCDFLVGGGTCSSCDGHFCNTAADCCPGTPCLQNRCGGCRDRAVVCTPGGQPCCDSDCTLLGGTSVCLSAAGGRCKHDANCATCYLNSSQCPGACVDGICQR